MNILQIPLTNIYYFDIMLAKEYEAFIKFYNYVKIRRGKYARTIQVPRGFLFGGFMQEVWKDIKGYEGLYQVSNFGNVQRQYKTKPNRKLKFSKDKNGYLRVGLCRDNFRKSFFVHRLVAIAFIENSYNYPVVNHKDENTENNNVENLEWCSVQYNTRYNNAHLKRAKKLWKPILQISLDGQIIKEWKSRSEIVKTLGYSGGNISACCLKFPHKISAYGFMWKYK